MITFYIDPFADEPHFKGRVICLWAPDINSSLTKFLIWLNFGTLLVKKSYHKREGFCL